MNSLKKIAVLLGCTALTAGIGLSVDGGEATEVEADAPAPSSKVVGTAIFSSFSESFSSTTPEDWATSADHIAVITVVSEREGVSDSSSIQRLVTVQVDRVDWSRNDATPLPSSFETTAFGWSKTEAGLAEMAAANAPRLEPGHRYVAALILLEPRCNEDDGLVVEGEWSLIGSEGAIPFDGRDIGFGEIEGRDRVTVDGIPGSMAHESETARNPADIVSVVKSADFERRPEQPGVREGC